LETSQLANQIIGTEETEDHEMDLLADIQILFSWVTQASISGDVAQASFLKCSCQRGNAPKYYVVQEKVRIGSKTINEARSILIEKVKPVSFSFRIYHYAEVNVS
jgi:hypothetical protein